MASQQSIIVVPRLELAPAAPEPEWTIDEEAEIRELVNQSLSEHSKAAYRVHWKHFTGYCLTTGRDPLPAHEKTVSAYISHCLKTEGANVRTVDARLAAVKYFHAQASLPSPTNSPLIRATMKGARRKYSVPPVKKTPITFDELRPMISLIDSESYFRLAGIRDKAILLLGFAGAFRRSELTSLNVTDLSFNHVKMTVTIRKSKTDQEGQGQVIEVPMLDDPAMCPVRAVRRWLDEAGIASGFVFRQVDQWGHVRSDGLTPQVVASIVKRYATKTGLSAHEFAGHSLRRGLVTEASRRDQATADVMKVTRHKKYETVAGYMGDDQRVQLKVIRAVFHDAGATDRAE